MLQHVIVQVIVTVVVSFGPPDEHGEGTPVNHLL